MKGVVKMLLLMSSQCQVAVELQGFKELVVFLVKSGRQQYDVYVA